MSSGNLCEQSNLKVDIDSQNTSAISNEEISYITPSQLVIPHSGKIKKKGNACYCLNIMQNYGNLHLFNNDDKSYFSKIQLIEFNDHFDELLEKGKSDLNEYAKLQEAKLIPSDSFWHQRFYYYSKFSEGILMDNECWWSVTPEIIAEYIANLAGKEAVVIDGFCGSGGNVIQFSRLCKKIYAIDIDQYKLDICKNNCNVYGCRDNIEYIHSDFLLMENSPIFKDKADYIFLSPPWGGVKYKNNEVYNIKTLMTPNIYDIIRVSLKISKRIMFYLPRTLQLEDLFEIVNEILNKDPSTATDRLFFDVHLLQSAHKIKALLIIFGNCIGTTVTESDLSEFIKFKYKDISDVELKTLKVIAKILGNYKFLQAENYFYKIYGAEDYDDLPSQLIKYFYSDVFNVQEKNKFRSYGYNPKKHKNDKNNRERNNNNVNSNDSKCNDRKYERNSESKKSKENQTEHKEKNNKNKWSLQMINEIHIEFLPL